MFKHENVISVNEETNNISETTVHTVVVDIHEDEIVTVDSAIKTIETNVSEDIVINEPVEDTAIPSKDYPF